MKKLILIPLLLTGFLGFAQFGELAKEAPKTGTFKSAPKSEEPEKTDVYYFEQANAEIDKRGSYNNVVFENIEKAIELNPDNAESLQYKIKDCERNIQEIKEKISQLK